MDTYPLLAVVTLRQDIPIHNLKRGQMGTIVDIFAPDVYHVEFSDDDGQTLALIPLLHEHLDLGYTVPVTVAGVSLRAKPEQVQSYNQAMDKLHAAVAHLWRTIRAALRLG